MNTKVKVINIDSPRYGETGTVVIISRARGWCETPLVEFPGGARVWYYWPELERLTNPSKTIDF